MSGHPPLPSTPIDLPMLPLRDVVVFPHMVIPLFVGRPKSIKALESAMSSDRRIMLVAQKTAAKDEPDASDMFDVGAEFQEQRLHMVFGGRKDLRDKFKNDSIGLIQMDLADDIDDESALQGVVGVVHFVVNGYDRVFNDLHEAVPS